MVILEENMAIDWHSSWQYIRHWKQGWTIDINQTDGGIWWQRLNECKRHQSASDYCNCHQIPPRPLTGHADPPHTLPYISAPLAQLDPEHHRCSSWNTQQTYTHKHTHTHCPLVLLLHLLEILMSCTEREGLNINLEIMHSQN